MRKYIFFAIIIIFFGCDEKNISEPDINYYLEKIEPTTTFSGDTVTITGNDFGEVNFKSSIVISPDIEIFSEDVLLWQNTKIMFEVPEKAQSGNIGLYVLDSLIGSVFLEIVPTPPYSTITIEAKSFSMGSDAGAEDELPVHIVNIDRNIEVMTKEVTARLFKSVMGYLPAGNSDIHLPVRNVRWIEAVKFSNHLSKLTELDTCYTMNEDFAIWEQDCNGWRLPTEAEWEYLAKADNNFDFPNNSDLFEYAWFSQNSGLKIHPGGKKLPNEFGLYDMNGNVREWCWDFYGREYYSESPQNYPTGTVSGEFHVSRGGSAIEGAYFSRNSSRKSSDYSIAYTGIRLVRTINN
jgi:sulfatase modifying factor 1